MKRALLGLLVAAPALADPSGHKWFAPDMPVPYVVLPQDTIKGLPAGAFMNQIGGHGPVLGVIQDAFHEWTCFNAGDCRVPGTSWTSVYNGTYTSPAGHAALNSMDSINHVFFEAGADWTYSMATLGLTTTTFFPGSGQIIDADMELNNNVTWDDQGAAMAYDYPSVIIHEAGHFLGLNHTASQVAVMYAIVPIGQTGQKRTLSSLDLNDVISVYPGGSVMGTQGAACTNDAACMTGLKCRGAAGGGQTICTVDCTGGAACPAPLTCQTANTGKACLAPPASSDYCAFCTDGAQCAAGICLTDGYGHNWCTAPCTPGASCGVGSTCLDVATANPCASMGGSCVCAPNAGAPGHMCPGQCTGATCPTPGFACNSGTCEATGGLGDRCEQTGLCGQCLMCIGDTTAAYCLTCCGGDTADCMGCPVIACPGGQDCTTVGGTNDSVCVAQGGAGHCEACGAANCLNGETCIGGLCHATCNPAAPGLCTGCAAESATTGLCVCSDAEISTEGGSCGVNTSVKACSAGLICAQGKCSRPCVVGDPNSCPGGQTCTLVGGAPACVSAPAGGKCSLCNGQTCNNGFTCFQGRCYATCNVTVKNGPCDATCVDTGAGLNLCACDDQISGVGQSCGGSPVAACGSGLMCISGACEGRCDPTRQNICPILTECMELAGSPGTFVCQPIDTGSGGGDTGTGGGGGTHHNGGGGVGGGGTDSGCGCGAAPGGLVFAALLLMMRRRNRSG